MEPILWIVGIVIYFVVGWKVVDLFLGDKKEQTERGFYLFLIIIWPLIAVCLIAILGHIILDNSFFGRLAKPSMYKDGKGNVFLQNAHIGKDSDIESIIDWSCEKEK